MLKSSITRSLLFKNVDVMLENISAIRQRNKIASDDLFGDAGDNPNIVQWKQDSEPFTDFQVLLLEKESLGIYVSGNPLTEYKVMQEWVRETTFTDEIHLVIINKVRKIFTKTNHMMFALDLSTTGESVEGIIFPKLAPHYSNIIEEKDLYWIKGRISKKKKKKVAPLPLSQSVASEIRGEDSLSDTTEEILTDSMADSLMDTATEIKEYDELPKLIIDAICKFQDGPMPLFDDSTSISVSRTKMIEAMDWTYLKSVPSAFGDDSEDSNLPKPIALTQNSHLSTPKINNTQKVVLKKHLGAEKLKQIHQSIKRTAVADSTPIELWVESGGELKKVKGPLWISIATLNEFGLSE